MLNRKKNMSRSKKASKTNNRRRKTSMKNKKYFAGDYETHVIDGKPVQCIYPDGTDKSFAAMFGFRKNCSKIPGFVPPVDTATTAPTTPDLSPIPEVAPEEAAAPTAPTEPFTNTAVAPVVQEPEPEPVVEISPPAPAPAAPVSPITQFLPVVYTPPPAPKGGRRRKYSLRCR